MKINGIEYENIKQIVIYGNGEKLFTVKQEYFEEYTERNGKFDSVYDGRIYNLTLSQEPKKAIKENLNRKDNYLLKYVGDYSWDNGKSLYIHNSEISAEYTGEKLAFESNGQKCYLKSYKLHFNHACIVNRNQCEKIVCDGTWKIPADKNWTWGSGYGKDYDHAKVDTFDTTNSKFAKIKGLQGEKGVIVRWKSPETIYSIDTAERGYSRIEKDENRINRESLAEIMSNATNKKFSHYDIENLLKVVNITVK